MPRSALSVGAFASNDVLSAQTNADLVRTMTTTNISRLDRMCGRRVILDTFFILAVPPSHQTSVAVPVAFRVQVVPGD